MPRSKPKVPLFWSQDLRAGSNDRRVVALAAAFAACLAADACAARRVAIVEALADGRTHLASALRQRVAVRLGKNCWGRSPDAELWADLRLLRQGGLRIGYSRRPAALGYFLYDPPLRLSSAWPDRPNARQIAAWRTWGSARKLEAMFGAWDLALDLARAGARNRHPDWSAKQIEVEARRLAGGAKQAEENVKR